MKWLGLDALVEVGVIERVSLEEGEEAFAIVCTRAGLEGAVSDVDLLRSLERQATLPIAEILAMISEACARKYYAWEVQQNDHNVMFSSGVIGVLMLMGFGQMYGAEDWVVLDLESSVLLWSTHGGELLGWRLEGTAGEIVQ